MNDMDREIARKMKEDPIFKANWDLMASSLWTTLKSLGGDMVYIDEVPWYVLPPRQPEET